MDGPPGTDQTRIPEITIPTPLDRLSQTSQGVGGWLLLFVLSLVIFGPAARVLNFLGGYRPSLEVFAKSSHGYSLYMFYFIEQLTSFAVCGYGIVVGIRLWRICPGAVQQAKRFLLSLLLFAFLDYTTGIVWFIGMTPGATQASALSRVLYGQAFMALLQTAAYTAIWHAYLWKSQRVRMTFSQDPPRGLSTT
jgi:hypothetical protein